VAPPDLHETPDAQDSWAKWRPIAMTALWTALCVLFSVLAYRSLGN
jgi:hypothetical protein